MILFRAYTTMKEEKEAKGECRTTRHMDVVVVPGGRRCRSEGEKGKEEERDTHCIWTGREGNDGIPPRVSAALVQVSRLGVWCRSL